MSADNLEPDIEREPVASWLLPVGDDEPCGPDLEYDLDFLELQQSAAGKPETQFSAAEPPQWQVVREQAEALLNRSRDLRLAVLWGRACLNLDGFGALGEVLRLLDGLLDRFWETLHPALDPDDDEAFARISVLGTLDKVDGLLGDVRQSLVVNDRRLGGLRVRDLEIAQQKLPARPEDTLRSLGEIAGMLGDHPDLAARLKADAQAAGEMLRRLQRTMQDRLGIENTVEVKTLRAMIDSVVASLPDEAPDDDAPADDEGMAGDDEGNAPSSRVARSGGGVGTVQSRQDALRAIRMVREYLERTEPTNPAQFLLKRAERVIEMNFLEVVRHLAPDAVNEVARILGVDPDSDGNED